MADQAVTTDNGSAPARAKAVLGTLILVAAVANLPLAVANVALPDIGKAFDASQTQLNLVAVGYSLGLACSVLWLGALGDRYGRKLMCLLGVIIANFLLGYLKFGMGVLNIPGKVMNIITGVLLVVAILLPRTVDKLRSRALLRQTTGDR